MANQTPDPPEVDNPDWEAIGQRISEFRGLNMQPVIHAPAPDDENEGE